MIEIFSELEKFNHITYYDAPHKYFVGDREMVSATTFIGKFEKPFDSDYWASKKAKDWGTTVEEVKAKWKLKADISCEKGTVSHEYIENLLSKKVYPYPAQQIQSLFEGEDPVKDKFANIAKLMNKFVSDIRGRMIPIKSEFIVGDEEFGICGMIDQIFYNTKSNSLEIWDWKTNEDLSTESKYKLLHPISHLADSKLDIYSLQLSLYKTIIERNTNLKIGACYLTWFNENNADYKVFKCHDYRNEILSMVDYWKSGTMR